MPVRLATDADVGQVVGMGLRFVSETEYAGSLLDPDPARMESVAKSLVGGDSSAVLVTEDDSGAVVGMLGVMVAEQFVTGELLAYELFWWIQPENRSYRRARDLLREAEAWARARGARAMHFVAPNARVGKLYHSVGYAPFETTYRAVLGD